jgi:hypothetical protein
MLIKATINRNIDIYKNGNINGINGNIYKNRLRSCNHSEVTSNDSITTSNIICENESQCLICWDIDQQTNKLFKMKDIIVYNSPCECNGNFHIKCLTNWVKVSKSCPICREILTIDFNILAQIDPYYKYRIILARCKYNINIFANTCYTTSMIMIKYVILLYSINIFVNIMRTLLDLSSNKRQF